jgi:GNAT superfamily N-acetyltransferase
MELHEQPIRYALEPNLSVESFLDILHRSGLAERRPVGQPDRIDTMLRHADLIGTARDSCGVLVGVARAISDFAYCTYLSDLAVDRQWQRQGIGRRLITEVHQAAGLQTRLVLLAAPSAQTYYPRIGMEQHPSCWMIPPEF